MFNKYYSDMENFMKVVSYPQIYQVEITEKCNLSCPTCLNSKIDRPIHASKTLIDTLIEQKAFRNTIYTELQMSGEPSLHPDAWYFVEKLKVNEVYVGASTNLAFVNLVFLHSLDCVTISADSLIKEYYELSRYPAKFEPFKLNLAAYLTHRPDNQLVFVQFLRTRLTEGSFERTMIEFDNIMMDVINKEGLITRYVDDCFLEQRDDGGVNPFINKSTCLNPFLAVSIKSDGTVVPCCFDFTKELALGNIFEQDLSDIWNGERIKQLRRQHLTQRYLPRKCMTCCYRSPILLMNSFISDLVKWKM